MPVQIGAQMYTLRDHCKTPSDIAKSCAKVKAMGYGAIQASAGGFNDIDPKELRKILDDNGLICAATHKSLDQMKDTDRIVDWHQTVGCSLTAIGGWTFDGKTMDEWHGFFKDYSAVGKTLAARGLKVGYHNHSHEFSPFGLAEDPAGIDPAKTPMQMMLDNLDPSIWFEVDTYWVAHAGGDPAQWISKCKGRIDAIHVKDMTITPKREHKMCEVGRGNLNWPAILKAAKDAGVKYYLVERDAGDVDPFESLKISCENLKSWGLE